MANFSFIIDQEFRQNFRKLLTLIVGDLREKLAEQGHVNTGRLSKSLRFEIRLANDGIEGFVFFEEYGIYIDKGVAAERIPFSFGSGRSSSKYIKGLIQYFRQRGLPSKQAKSAAFATAVVHKREGMPTKASSRFSKTGERTGFLTKTVRNKERLYISFLGEQAVEGISVKIATEFRDIFKDVA